MGMNSTLPISRGELQRYLTRSDWQGLKVVIWIWGSTIAVFALAVMFPYWYVYLLVLFLFAGRMQGLSALVHEAGHNTLFKTKYFNEWVRDWFSAPFVFMDGKAYAENHLLHHKYAGTEQDPDLDNYRHYPISKQSFMRKCLRDFSGWTGLKLITYWVITGKDAISKEKRTPFTLIKGLLANGIIFLVLYLVNAPLVFVLWIVSHFTVYMFIVRFRQISEHAGVCDVFSKAPKFNTRSIPQGVLGIVFFSPTTGLSYHCEHHAFMAVPTYHLKALHNTLVDNGYYDDAPLYSGYMDVLHDIFKSPSQSQP